MPANGSAAARSSTGAIRACFPLVGAVWGELPSARDELRLRQVACGLPAGSVASSVLICRTPHSLPLGEGLNALPLSELTSHWCSG